MIALKVCREQAECKKKKKKNGAKKTSWPCTPVGEPVLSREPSFSVPCAATGAELGCREWTWLLVLR